MGRRSLRMLRIPMSVAVGLCSLSILWAASPASAATGSWSNPSLFLSPYARYGGAMAFDPISNTTVLFGGDVPNGPYNPTTLNDTWEWNGSTWSVDHPATAPEYPSLGETPALAYDPLNRGLILFDGQTWEWTGSSWNLLQPANVPTGTGFSIPGNHPTMATDTDNGSVVLLVNDNDTNNEETWEWNGSDWVQESPVVEPPCCGIIGYDPAHNTMLYQVQDQTWEWDGFYWLQLNPADEINPIAMTAGPEGSGLLAITGTPEGSPLSTYEWTGTDWRQVETTTVPLVTAGPSLADGPTGVVLFGGGTTTGSDVSNATWVFATDQTTPPANTPEVPYVLALPLLTFGLISGTLIVRRRRERATNHP